MLPALRPDSLVPSLKTPYLVISIESFHADYWCRNPGDRDGGRFCASSSNPGFLSNSLDSYSERQVHNEAMGSLVLVSELMTPQSLEVLSCTTRVTTLPAAKLLILETYSSSRDQELGTPLIQSVSFEYFPGLLAQTLSDHFLEVPYSSLRSRLRLRSSWTLPFV